MERRVVVTGTGVISPVGNDTSTAFEALTKGSSGIGKITQFNASAFDAYIAGEVKNFDPSSYIPFKDLRRTPRFVQFSLGASIEAVKQSGIDFSKMDPFRVGVIIGSGIGSLQSIEEQYQVYRDKGPSRISPFLIPMLITNEACGHVAIHFKLKGVNFCTVTACASGAHAIGEAYKAIKYGEADVILTGGTEASITHLGVGGFCALKALSKRNDQPTKASRPFDAERDGFVMSEGAATLVLEELETAKKRNAPILAEICGYGATCDAYHITAPDPSGEAVARAIEIALTQAKVRKEDVGYINAHGTSTKLNDKIETAAIKRVFGSIAPKIPVSSTKSMTGHLLGAAGAIEAVFVIMTILKKVIPPTINLEHPDPECDLDYVPNSARAKEVSTVLSNSLGFGGHNISLLFKKYKG